MKVRDLIKKLENVDPDTIVVTTSTNIMEHGEDSVQAVTQIIHSTMETRKRKVEDAYDYTEYEIEEYEYSHGDGIKTIRFDT